MPNFTASLSSVGTSPVANLAWGVGKPVTASVVPGSSTQTSDFMLQFTMDDLQLTAASAVQWQGLSSAVGQPATHFQSSVCYPDGVANTFLGPVAALRISASALSSGSLKFKVMEGELP